MSNEINTTETVNTTLDSILIEQIEKASGAIDTAVEFTVEQAPDVIHQALLWHGTINFIYFILGMIFFIAPIVIIWKITKRFKDIEDGKSNIMYEWLGGYSNPHHSLRIEYCFGVFMFWFVFTFIGGCLINLEWLKIWIAPKLWLIEYAASLAK